MRITCSFLILWMLSAGVSHAQSIPLKINFGAGHAFLGTGDQSGYTFFSEAEIPFRRSNRFTWSPGLQFSGHAKTINLLPAFEYRSVTSGLTAWLKLDYALLLRARHRITIGAGPSLRYQSDSQPEIIGSRLDPSGSYILDIQYVNKLNSLAFGYIIAPQYQLMISKKVALGLRLMVQNDTRADLMISQVITAAVSL